MAHLLISAAHKSSGKTTVSMGLCAALQQRGLIVQPFKKGPDYIDPMWLSQASQRSCHNLDYHTMGKDELRGTFRHYMQGADIGIIEGNKGLYDGLDLEGRNSNAALARLLKAPVVLVISAQGMTRGIAPLILGYQAFDERINIAGVILNKLGGKRHEGKLRAVIEHYTDVPVIGAVQKSAALDIDERHLGLIPSNEAETSSKTINTIAQLMAQQVDLDRLIDIANIAKTVKQEPVSTITTTPKDVRLGVARDSAFGFYYPSDLEALENAGAELVFFDAINDQHLPEIDGLFIGGGFPETQAEKLAANTSLKSEIRTKIENGLPVYAECGGLMYLSRALHWKDKHYAMCEALALDTVMYEKPQGRGYVRLKETDDFPWPVDTSSPNSSSYCAHEFHYSKAENISGELRFGYKMQRGFGVDGSHDGVIYKNTFASYTHLRDVAHNRWASRFINFVRQCKQNKVNSSETPYGHQHQAV